MSKKIPMRLKGYIGLGLVCVMYWVLDSIWSYLSFEHNLKNLIVSESASYIDTLLLRVPPYQMVSRLMVVAIFTILGSVILEFMSKRKTAEKERRYTHNTLLMVLNSIDATIYVADMQNNEILFMNQHMIDSFKGNFTGNICYEAFQNNTKPCEHCTNNQLLDESGNPKGVVVWENRNPITNAWYINYDRAIKWVDDRMVRLQIATDITQLKDLQEKRLRAESKLRQLQKMESIGTLAGGIAHDFNNILASILGFTELAIDDVEKGSAIEDNLQEVYTAGKRARDLVKQILTFARQSDEEQKPVKVDTIAKEALRLMRSTIPTTIEIRQKIESQSLIMCNPTQVHQLFVNLCTNAAQAMESAGGILQVGMADVQFDEDSSWTQLKLTPGNYLKVTVSDNGPGIAPDIIDSIFEPYFTTKGVGEGTGMGLAMVHGIVKACGGQITVESQLGAGTTFSIYLPVTKKRDDYRPYEDERLPLGKEHILFVDDELPIANMGSQMLERLGYRVTVRTSSVEALALFRARPDDFDLVITDMTMPNMTGDQLAAELIEIRPDMPIILCTGYSKKVSDGSAIEKGIKAFAYKPIVRADLAKTVRQVLDEAKGASE